MPAYRDSDMIPNKSFIEQVKDITIKSATKIRFLEDQETDKYSLYFLKDIKKKIIKAGQSAKHTVTYHGTHFFNKSKWNMRVATKLVSLLIEEGFVAEIKNIKSYELPYNPSWWVEVTWKQLC